MNKGRAVVFFSLGVALTAGFIWLEYSVLGRQEWPWTLAGIIAAALVPIVIAGVFTSGVKAWIRPNANELRLEAQAKQEAAAALAAAGKSREAAAALDAYVALRAREAALGHRVMEFEQSVKRLREERSRIEDEAWRLGDERDIISADVLSTLDDLARKGRPVDLPTKLVFELPIGLPFAEEIAQQAAEAVGRFLDRMLTARRRAKALNAPQDDVKDPSPPASAPPT